MSSRRSISHRADAGMSGGLASRRCCWPQPPVVLKGYRVASHRTCKQHNSFTPSKSAVADTAAMLHGSSRWGQCAYITLASTAVPYRSTARPQLLRWLTFWYEHLQSAMWPIHPPLLAETITQIACSKKIWKKMSVKVHKVR
jgi:hypothetical protein